MLEVVGAILIILAIFFWRATLILLAIATILGIGFCVFRFFPEAVPGLVVLMVVASIVAFYMSPQPAETKKSAPVRKIPYEFHPDNDPGYIWSNIYD